MTETICQKDAQKGFDCIQEMRSEIADNVIGILRKLELEYDSMVKSAEERLDDCQYEIKNSEKNGQYFVNDFVEQNVAICSDLQRRWENEELSMNIADIQMMVKSLQEKNQRYLETKSVMEKGLKMEMMEIDALNKQITDSQLNVENIQTIQEQLNSVIDDLENLSVVKSIYPTAILEMYTEYSNLQTRVKEMENELLKYADLPPDYTRAKLKLAEAMSCEKELERRIRNAVK